ncbi:MAG: maleylpyruvate isomerase family mycothiol-dependent enzyme [Acidimicrobiales bacterium]
MSNGLQALHNSVQHLKDLAAGMDPEYYTSSAYPSDWTIADTFSHLGSGAVIAKQSFENSIAAREPDPSFNTSVWDEWNAKPPADQVADCLQSDASYLEVLERATEKERGEVRLSLGPFTFDFAGMVGLRLGEHVLHTWDVEVPFNPDATLSSEAADAILDNLQFVAARAAKPDGLIQDVTVRTSDPVRTFTLALKGDTAELRETPHDGAVDLEIPAEAFVRLVYGRLDPGHTPDSVTGDFVELLRGVYAGF